MMHFACMSMLDYLEFASASRRAEYKGAGVTFNANGREASEIVIVNSRQQCRARISHYICHIYWQEGKICR